MRPLILRLALFLLLAVAPCVAMAQQSTSGDTALQRALDHYHAGKLNEAAGLLRGFAVSQPDSPLLDKAYYYLAMIHRDLGEPVVALDYLNRAAPEGEDSPSRLLLHSELMLATGNTILAVDQLLGADIRSWSLPDRQERELALAAAFLALDEPHRALYFHYRALLTEGRETPREILARVYTLLSDRFDDAALAETAFMYAETPVGSLAMLHLGWRALAAGQKELARQWAAAVMAAPAGFPYRDEALTLQSQLSDPSQLQRAIGVLLPLSGRYAAFGEQVRRGMELAQETLQTSLPIRFIYRDTAGDELVAAQQVAELAIAERVLAIAGPLVGNAAAGAARRANQEQVPLLTLSQREGLAASSLYVFRNSLTPQLQVRALVEYAVGERGFTRFGILSPQTRQGELFAEMFREELLRRGVVLVAAQSYKTDQTDFRYQVRLLQGRDPGKPDEDEDEDEVAADGDDAKQTPPPFQALFLPDYADRVGLIAPQLVFYGLERVQLLGTNGWNDADLPRIGRQFVEGAVFTDGFFKHSPYPFVREFGERFFNKYAAEPGILEAQGFDIATILLTLADRPDVRSREDLRRALAQMPTFPGVTGATRFDALGEADKILFLLQIQNGNIVQLN